MAFTMFPNFELMSLPYTSLGEALVSCGSNWAESQPFKTACRTIQALPFSLFLYRSLGLTHGQRLFLASIPMLLPTLLQVCEMKKASELYATLLRVNTSINLFMNVPSTLSANAHVVLKVFGGTYSAILFLVSLILILPSKWIEDRINDM